MDILKFNYRTTYAQMADVAWCHWQIYTPLIHMYTHNMASCTPANVYTSDR